MENERIIIETDGDLEAVASVTATVNANGELVVEHDFEDYEDSVGWKYGETVLSNTGVWKIDGDSIIELTIKWGSKKHSGNY